MRCLAMTQCHVAYLIMMLACCFSVVRRGVVMLVVRGDTVVDHE